MNRSLAPLYVAILFAQTSFAATFTGVLNVESNSAAYDSNLDIYTYQNQISVASLPNFNFPFSTLGDTDFSVTWQAPTNYRIQITPPSGFDFVQVVFQFATGSSGYNVGQINPSVTLGLTDFTGNTLPTMNPGAQFTGPQTSTLPADSAGAFVFASGFAFDEPFYLSSATVQFSVPDAYNVDFNALVSDFEVLGSAVVSQPTVAPTDPGQWITLVVVPEPSSVVALLGFYGIGFARRRR